MNSKQAIICLSSTFAIHFLFYVFLIFLSSNAISPPYNVGNETDHQALLKIKSMINPEALTSWNISFHFCDWTGVTCGKWHRRVTSIVLESQGLEGLLSPYVGNLSFLYELQLVNNSFKGAIPHELGRLSKLRFFNLNQNKFNGVIPTNISGCSNLEYLHLSHNELVGSIPKEISFLSKLTFLSLFNNDLTGGLPPFLGNITSMELLSVARNPLGGIIPDTLGNWKNLKYIYCADCNLYGTIPPPLYNLSLLTNISLSANQLSGSLPLAIGTMLPRLVYLQLWSNELSGPFPPSISNCSRLTHLEITRNSFSGKLTIDFAKLRYISFIRLGSNLFGSKEADEMKFIDSLKNCTQLKRLGLGDCNFQGVLPSSIGNLSKQLQFLSFAVNQIHGNIPTSIGDLVGLELLSFGSNRFTGHIPSSIGNLRNLNLLHMPNNKLSGPIPDAIRNLSMLIYLDLSVNRLNGRIPSSLGSCNRLLRLHLNENKLNGNIPTSILQLPSLSITLNLSQNNLSGSLPIEVGNLKMLSSLDLSDNNFSGNIPDSLGGCDSLSWLSLKGNLFQGIIPPSLSSLKGLTELDVSYNNLSGQIPPFLEAMFVLRHLNLSYNDFEGEVPVSGVFANVSAFSILGNGRLCGGNVELGLPKCKEHKRNFPLFVIVILIASIFFTITCLAYAWCKKKSKIKSRSLRSEQFMKVSYNQLLKATNGFSEANLIGKGGFSSVYKGIFDEDDDTFVAVKVLHLQNQGAQRSFMRECEALRNMRHRNLLKIVTSCSSVDFQGNEFKALVYEFMPNGSLHDWLHSKESTSRLNLLQIIKILMDIAYALDYIHNHCIPTVVHGDLKPSNILLDDDMVAHVGDFGLARLLGTSYPNNLTGNIGTIGYVAPEYGLGSEMTSSGDVYSFGILVLEVMTGKKPTDDIFNEDLCLRKFASMALRDHVTDIIDANITHVYQEDKTVMQNKEANVKKIEESLASTVKIGISCSLDPPTQRMDIKRVVHELQQVLDTLENS